MKRLFVVCAAVWFIAMLLVGLGRAAPGDYQEFQNLDNLSTLIAGKPTSVHCVARKDDTILRIAWGYKNWFVDDHVTVDLGLCLNVEALLSGTPYEDWQAALGILVVTHESYHNRDWDMWGNEAVVECHAIRHWTTSAKILGVSEEDIARLKPWALAMHWRLVRKFPEYYLKSCKTPNPY